MRLVTFKRGGEAHVGARLENGELVDLTEMLPQAAPSMRVLAGGGRKAMSAVREAVRKPKRGAVVKDKGGKLLPPVPDPGKILCIGLNYKTHAEETGNPLPTYPVVFPRFTNTLVGHGRPMAAPAASVQFDYEAELAVIIGKGGRHIPREDALKHVFGYSCFNDGSVRDYQMRTSQYTVGKNFDATGGFGPEIVTPEALPEGAAGLRILCRLNGESLQDGTTSDLIFDVPTLIAELSAVMTLDPGDVIITGTPSGVGVARKPQVFMKAGDVCEVEIEGIGILRNPIVQGS